MRRILILVAILTSISSASIAASEGEVQASAEAWLGLVDSQRYEQSWTEAGGPFQSAIPQNGWAGRVKIIRDALGPEKSRQLRKVTFTKTLEGFPNGDYAIVEFTSSFANRASAIETVNLENDHGKFKTIGYFIR